ncbi:flagellar capping protein [Clostridium liquoris]|uniref:Flagellar hook-associated protein 2 n=1 Tax=Clostridium liquoris TaxID=1289519 RepID=A0A2T0B686_9CLOT|nr:flagellar filament capping protein FliD [Clostridium liquoris]PRR79400.1 flagellar capping protein [Clostridium liquoris]
MTDSISGLTGAGGGSMMRITGMATGLDVDAMVKKMMLGEQAKIDKVAQERQTIVWKQEAYQDIIKDIKDLQDTYFDVNNGSNYIKSPNYYSSADVTVNSANTTFISATAGSGSKSGTYKISYKNPTTGMKDGHLATAARVSGAVDKANTSNPSLTTTMSDLGLGSDTTLEFSYNGKPNVTINIKTTDKISDVINSISKETSGEVKASFSELTGKFTMETANIGSSQSIKIINGVANLGLTDTTEKNGDDALVYITPPGSAEAVPVTKQANNFTIDGISYNLLEAEDSTFTVTQNTQKLYDKIDGFLKKYNDIVDKIQTKLTEKKDLNYKPLTDAQKKDMKDDEIKAWEEKAKKGVLRNDNNLQNLLNDLRSSFMTAVDGVSLRIGQYGADAIGIDTGDPKEGGKINIFNQEKFKNAIAQHGDELMNLFNKTFVKDDAYNNITGTSEEDKKRKQQQYKFQHQGIFQRIDDILVKNVGYAKTTLNSSILIKYANKQEDFSIFGASGSNTLPDQIYRKDNKIKELNSKMKDKENALYMQFSRLETVMNNYNSQAAWLAQQFGG